MIAVGGVRFLTMSEAAARVERSRRTVERWRLPRYRIGRLRMVREDELLAAFRVALVSNPVGASQRHDVALID